LIVGLGAGTKQKQKRRKREGQAGKQKMLLSRGSEVREGVEAKLKKKAGGTRDLRFLAFD
jgi:hypothetical protein